MDISTGICSIDGASSRTPNASFECVIGSSPAEFKSLFVGLIVIVLFLLYMLWLKHSAKLKLEEKYTLDDFTKMVIAPALFIAVVVAILVLV